MVAANCKEARCAQAGLRRVALPSSAAGVVLLLALTWQQPSAGGYHDPLGGHIDFMSKADPRGPLGQTGPDSDGDGVYDADESACGGDGLDPSVRPERRDGAFFGVSDDGDAQVDELLPSGSENYDCDGDGWTGNRENLIFSAGARLHDQDPCGNNGWPADLDPDNDLNIGDLGSFFFPARPNLSHNYIDAHGDFNKFGHPLDDANNVTGVPPPDGTIDPLMARWNIEAPEHLPATVIQIGDLNALNPAVLASTARPPMFGGQPAYLTDLDGPGPMTVGACPWPP